MSRMQFLCDEHVPKGLQNAVRKLNLEIVILAVDETGGPAKETSDPELLIWSENQRFALLTSDVKTMPGHTRDHLAAGGNTWGVFELRKGYSLGRPAEEIVLLWSASEAEEWRGAFQFIPFT